MNNIDFGYILNTDFYERDTLEVTKDLLGCYLHRRLEDGGVLSGMIVETEAYKQDDPACHAFRGRTPRSETLFADPGLSYVYFIYGMYHCFNAVTEPKDKAGAVLIRALEPITPLTGTHGPARLCRAMNINRSLNSMDLTKDDSLLFITNGKKIPEKSIVQTTRVGISVATDFKWRFYIRDNKFVSIKKVKKIKQAN